MRTYAIDTDRTMLISAGVVAPMLMWVQLSDGSRRPDPNGRQAATDQGVPLWRVDVIAPADPEDERDQTSVVQVTVASGERPDPGPMGTPVRFDGLTVTPGYVRKGTSTLTPARWAAEGLRSARRAQAPAA